jgi:hypothetical protein
MATARRAQRVLGFPECPASIRSATAAVIMVPPLVRRACPSLIQERKPVGQVWRCCGARRVRDLDHLGPALGPTGLGPGGTTPSGLSRLGRARSRGAVA